MKQEQEQESIATFPPNTIIYQYDGTTPTTILDHAIAKFLYIHPESEKKCFELLNSVKSRTNGSEYLLQPKTLFSI